MYKYMYICKKQLTDYSWVQKVGKDDTFSLKNNFIENEFKCSIQLFTQEKLYIRELYVRKLTQKWESG